LAGFESGLHRVKARLLSVEVFSVDAVTETHHPRSTLTA
jgi:hypothetical protein